jgi:hypothetical protein
MKKYFNKFLFKLIGKRNKNIFVFNKYNFFDKTKEYLKPINDIKNIPDLKDFMNMKSIKDTNEIKKDFGRSNLDIYEESRFLTEPIDHLDENKSQIEKTFYLKTYGCQMNESDSEIICSILENNNFLRTDNIENVKFFNTLIFNLK